MSAELPEIPPEMLKRAIEIHAAYCGTRQATRERTEAIISGVIPVLASWQSMAARERALVEALRQILAISADRQAFVASGPRGFMRAEQIARAALAFVPEQEGR